MHRSCLFLLTLFSLPAVLSAQEGNFTNSLVLKSVTESELPEEAKYAGEIKGAVFYEDNAGFNYVLLAEEEGEEGVLIQVQHYQETGEGYACVFNYADTATAAHQSEFSKGSLQVIDLDGDGSMEISFGVLVQAYAGMGARAECLLWRDSKSISLSVNIPREGEDEKQKFIYSKESRDWKPFFRSYLIRELKEILENEINVSAKSMAWVSPLFRIMACEDMMGGGGTYYEITDGKGNPLSLAGMEENYLSQQYVILPGDTSLLYFANHKIMEYYPGSRKSREIYSLPQETESISDISLSPSGARVAFSAIAVEAFPQQTRLYLIALSEKGQAHVQFKELRVQHMAAAMWVLDQPAFVNENTLRYIHQYQGPDDTEEKTVTFK